MKRYLPPEHGAWAMLLVPYIVGVLIGPPVWAHVPLLIAWLGGYLLSYFAFLAIKTRRLTRVRSQVMAYAAVTVPAALATLVLRPGLLVFAPVYAALLAVNTWHAWRRSQRTLLNDLASVLQGCLIVPVAVVAAGGVAAGSVRPFLLVLLYFAGTVFYVKTMIRKRGDPKYLRASITYHSLAAVVATVIAWPVTALFAWLLARSVILPRRRRSPKQVGLIEIVNSIALIVAVVLATG